MQPDIYKSYLEALNDKKVLGNNLGANSSTQSFTIKNYKQKLGLSERFHEPQDQNDFFSLSGPFGKGLIQSAEGTYLIFAAGTGVLPFMDLVAFIAR